MYQRKQPFPGAETFRDRLAQAFAATLRTAVRLEDERAFDGRLKFRADQAVFRINDRLLAPNTRETFEQVAPDLRQFVLDVYGPSAGDVALDHKPSPLTLFEVGIKASRPVDVRALLERITPLVPSLTP
jgi:hypothetical protein